MGMSETAYYAGQFSLQGSMQALRETADLHKQRADLAEAKLDRVRQLLVHIEVDPSTNDADRTTNRLQAFESTLAKIGEVVGRVPTVWTAMTPPSLAGLR